MNKTILTAGLALLLPAFCVESASAWVNGQFGVGVNWTYQSGGNNFLWGVFRNGQPPAPAGSHHPGFMPHGQPASPAGSSFPQFYQVPNYGQAAPIAHPLMPPPAQTGYEPDGFPLFYPVGFER